MNSNRDTINILLVEDNPGDVLLAREALEDDPQINQLLVVGNGEEALSFLRKEGHFTKSPRPDLIMLDLNLPRKSGLELLAEIKNDSELCQIPVVVLTVSSSIQDIESAYSHHANCFITKPVNLSRFTEIIRRIKSFWFDIVTLPSQ